MITVYKAGLDISNKFVPFNKIDTIRLEGTNIHFTAHSPINEGNYPFTDYVGEITGTQLAATAPLTYAALITLHGASAGGTAPDLSNYVQKTRSIATGHPIVGGGDLDQNRAFSITPLGVGNFITGDPGGGNVVRKLVGSDFIGTGSGIRVYTWSGSAWGNMTVSDSASVANTLIYTSTGGQIRVGTAVLVDAAVRFQQLNGIINNTLSGTETAVTLNTKYPSALSGAFIVTSKTANMQYRKLEDSSWIKIAITTL